MSTPVKDPAQPRTERIARLLVSNDPPLDVEEKTYRVIVTQGQTRLIEIDEQIADIRAALETLLLHRDQLQAHINDHKAVMNPMRRLPADILSEIFALYAPPVDVHSMQIKLLSHDSLDVGRGPWVLGRVCRRWRSVVEELPVLWSSLNVVFDTNATGNRPLRHSLYLLGRYLRSAKSVPLSIGLFSRSDLSDNDNNPLLYSLTPYSDQWKNLRVLLTKPSSFQCMSYIKGQLNSLQSLYIGSSGHGALILPTEPSDAFSLAPHLRELAVKSLPSVWLMFSLPWSQITVYKWSRWSSGSETSHHLVALQHMPNLEEISLECRGSGAAGPAFIGQSVQLPRLRKLQLSGYPNEEAALLDLLVCIRGPALRDINISQVKGHDFQRIGVVKGFILKAACPLVNLGLPRASILTDYDLLQLLRHAPSLERILLGSDVLTDHLLGQLVDGDGTEDSAPPVAPNLHTITIKHLSAASKFSPKLFLDTIASRWSMTGQNESEVGHSLGQVARLRFVELAWKDKPPSSLLADPRLHQFRSEGLHIMCTSETAEES